MLKTVSIHIFVETIIQNFSLMQINVFILEINYLEKNIHLK